MRKSIRLYFSFAAVALRAQMMHRGAFITGVVSQFLSHGSRFLVIWFMVKAFDTLGGFTADQVLFFYGFNMLAYALAASVFFFPTKQLNRKIRSGEFDGSLTKPLNPLAHEIYLGFNPGYISHALLSVTVMAVSARGAGFTLSRLPLLLPMLLGAALVYSAWFVMQSVGSFWFVAGNPLDILMSIGRNFVEYPVTIYHRVIQGVLTFILPFAFMSFYPVSSVLGISGISPFPDWLGYLTPLVGAGLFLLSVFLWNRASRLYKSTGT